MFLIYHYFKGKNHRTQKYVTCIGALLQYLKLSCLLESSFQRKINKRQVVLGATV